MLICCFHVQKCARIQVLFVFVCFWFFDLDHFCCLSCWIYQAFRTSWQDVIMIFEVLLRAAYSYTFIYKLGHDFFVISTLDPQSTRQVDFCTAASIWFKGSREHRISSLPGSSVYNPGFVDVFQLCPTNIAAFLPWKTLCTLLQRPCCIVWEVPVISKQHAWFVALYDFLCVLTCKLQMQ